MRLSKLTNNSIRVLTEADYGLPEQMVDNFLDSQAQEANNRNQQQEELPVPEQTATQDQESTNVEEPNTQNQPEPQESSDQDIEEMEQSDGRYDLGEEIQDDYDAKDDIPKLKILNSLSDEEYKLNNVKCFKNFKELYSKVDNSINNNIMDIVTKNARQRQIVNMVHNNLSDMLDDLDNYMIFKFGDIYEDNILAYVTYLKRYHIAMKIIRLIIDENIKNSENPN